MSTYRISQLAQRSGVPATTLRFYESVGLLPARRTPAGYRTYDDAAIQRLAFISSAKLLARASYPAFRRVAADLHTRVGFLTRAIT